MARVELASKIYPTNNLQAYPLEAAVKDAVFMDGLCSVVTGLDQAAASVDATNEPGLDAATRTLLRARLAKEALDLPRDQLLKPEMLESIKVQVKEMCLEFPIPSI